MSELISAGALFSGIGGFCLGFEENNIRTKWAVENDSSAALTYRQNVKDVRLIEKDICEVDVIGSDLEPVTVLHAGFPCQSFSQAGGKKGFSDPRGKLFFEIIRLIEGFKDRKPAVLVFENSPYLRSGDGGVWFLELSKAIKRAGYWFRDSNCVELDTYNYTKLPQKRNRLFMVAFSTDHFRNGKILFPEIDTANTSVNEKDLSKYINFSGSLEDDSYYLDEENRYFQMIDDQADDKNCIYQLRKYIVRVKEPNVVPTLTANMGLGGHNVPFIYDQKGLRKLTEYECLRLQGFPANFVFPEEVPRARRYVQVGNAVSVPIAKLLSESVKMKIQKEMK